MEPTSDTRSDTRFDPHLAAQLLLEIAQERSLEKLLQKLAERVMERPHLVCAQVWLIEKGDLCATCKYRSECADQSRCLHLVAAKGRSHPDSGKKRPGFENLDARIPLGVGPVGKTVVAGQEKVFLDTENHPGLDWLREEGIRGSRIVPIWFKGEPFAGCLWMRSHR